MTRTQVLQEFRRRSWRSNPATFAVDRRTGFACFHTKGDDDEDHDANSASCRASAGFALCHRPHHPPVAERFRASSESGRLPLGVGRCRAEFDVSDELPIG